MSEESITFSAGPLTLEGLLSLPEPACSRGVVLCHPHPLYGGEMGNNVVSALARAMQDAGMATLRFNFRGVGRSQGEHGGGDAEVHDVNAAVTALLDRTSLESAAIAGYSFGAAAALRAGIGNPRVRRLVLVSPPAALLDAGVLAAFRGSTLVVAGGADEIAPAAPLEVLLRDAERTRLEVIPEADHFFMQGLVVLSRRIASWLG